MKYFLITRDSEPMTETTKAWVTTHKTVNLELTACPAYSSWVEKCPFQAGQVASPSLRKVTFSECISAVLTASICLRREAPG